MRSGSTGQPPVQEQEQAASTDQSGRAEIAWIGIDSCQHSSSADARSRSAWDLSACQEADDAAAVRQGSECGTRQPA